jgi:hypothetical protein
MHRTGITVPPSSFFLDGEPDAVGGGESVDRGTTV